MKRSRREFFQVTAGVIALPALSRIARAESYPTRPVRIIVGFAAGGNFDFVARLIAERMAERLGQPVIVENRPGAGSNIAAEAAIRSPSDGYTLFLAGAVNAINATLYDKLNFNFAADVAPVAGGVQFPNVMTVSASFPAKSVPDFIAYAKANPGKINHGSSGIGTSQHVSGELFKMMTGVDMTHIPYRGSAPALTDLLGGQVHVLFDTTAASIEFIRTGRLRALAVTTAMRSEALTDVPAMGDFVPGYEAIGWYGAAAPKDTPADIVERLNREMTAALADATVKAKLADLGAEPMPMTPLEFGKFVVAEAEKWGRVVFAGIKPE